MYVEELNLCIILVPDDAPGSFRVNTITSTTCNLMWSRPSVPNGDLIHYTISYNSTSGTEARVTVDGDRTDTVVTGLHPYTYYSFNVSASTRVGNGPSASIALRTEEDSKCKLAKPCIQRSS